VNVAHLEQTIRWDRSNRDPKHKGSGIDRTKLYPIGRDTSLILVVYTTLYFDCVSSGRETSKGSSSASTLCLSALTVPRGEDS
jgi:hypothetical protein